MPNESSYGIAHNPHQRIPERCALISIKHPFPQPLSKILPDMTLPTPATCVARQTLPAHC